LAVAYWPNGRGGERLSATAIGVARFIGGTIGAETIQPFCPSARMKTRRGAKSAEWAIIKGLFCGVTSG